MARCIREPLKVLAGVALVVLLAAAARADAIDGEWCGPDGKRMKIRGPEIITPGGKQVRGTHTQHSFVYVVPPDEAYAGETMSIYALSERLAQAYLGGPNQGQNSPVGAWSRCPPGVVQTRPARAATPG